MSLLLGYFFVYWTTANAFTDENYW